MARYREFFSAHLQKRLRNNAQNQPDGSVHIEAAGEEENLEKFIAWCKVGPPRAAVTDVVVTEGAGSAFDSFEIRR